MTVKEAVNTARSELIQDCSGNAQEKLYLDKTTDEIFPSQIVLAVTDNQVIRK